MSTAKKPQESTPNEAVEAGKSSTSEELAKPSSLPSGVFENCDPNVEAEHNQRILAMISSFGLRHSLVPEGSGSKTLGVSSFVISRRRAYK